MLSKFQNHLLDTFSKGVSSSSVQKVLRKELLELADLEYIQVLSNQPERIWIEMTELGYQKAKQIQENRLYRLSVIPPPK